MSDFLINHLTCIGSFNIAIAHIYECESQMCFLCLQILLGLVQFGFVVTYLSEPLVRGYTTGAAIHVIVSQLKYTFGINPERYSGPIALVYVRSDYIQRVLDIMQLLFLVGFNHLFSTNQTLDSLLLSPTFIPPDSFGYLSPRSTNKHWDTCGQYRHHRVSHHRQRNQCLLE